MMCLLFCPKVNGYWYGYSDRVSFSRLVLLTEQNTGKIHLAFSGLAISCPAFHVDDMHCYGLSNWLAGLMLTI